MRKRLRKKKDRQNVIATIDWWSKSAPNEYVKAINALCYHEKPMRTVK